MDKENKGGNWLTQVHPQKKKWLLKRVYVVVHVNSGPFQRSEMAGWHSAGFFTHNLLVKRGADIAFVQLGEGNFLLTARRCCFCPDCLYANRIVQKALSLSPPSPF